MKSTVMKSAVNLKRSSTCIVKGRQAKISKTDDIISKKLKPSINLCTTTLLRNVTDKDLEPFVKNSDLQYAFINARKHWIIADVFHSKIFSDIVLRQKIRAWECSNDPIVLDEYTRRRMVGYRMRNFLIYIKSKECTLFRKELADIGRKNLTNIRRKLDDDQYAIMHFIHLHEIHNLMLFNFECIPIGIPKITTKRCFKIDPKLQYSLVETREALNNESYVVFQCNNTERNYTYLTYINRPRLGTRCFEELACIFHQYHSFFSLIFAFSQ
jgi:hypothetical protein